MENDTDQMGWDTCFMRESCTLIFAHDATATTPANAVFEVSTDPYICNVDGTLHGGAASTILDNLPGEALHVAAWKRWIDYGSVSRTLTVTFLRPIVIGREVRVGVEIGQAGRTMANVRGVIRNANGRVSELCA